MKERFYRVEASGMTTAELAAMLGTTELKLARWITGNLIDEEADAIEIGLSLMELKRSCFESLRSTAERTLASILSDPLQTAVA